MFDNVVVSSSVHAVIADLKARMQGMEGPAARWPMPTHPVLAELLELRSGGAYCVQSPSLAMLVMAGPSAAGAWCAVVGVPQFGVEAAREVGVQIDRVVHVPDVPTGDMLAVLAALIDVVDVIVMPPLKITSREATRLVARMREKHCLIVTWGDWPQADAQIGWLDICWDGVGQGHGNLQARQVTLQVCKQNRVTGQRRLWFPDENLVIRSVEPVRVLRSLP